MSKEILLVVESVSNEKGVSPEVIFGALEYALEAATKKKYANDIDVKVTIDRKTGNSKTTTYKTVVADDELDSEDINQISISDASAKNKSIKTGDILEEELDTIEFSRVSAQMAKQAIYYKIKQAEKEKYAEFFSKNIGTLLTGTVKKITRDKLIIDLGNNAEGVLKKDCLISKEHFKLGDHIKALLKEITYDVSGPQIILSRTDPKMIIELFRLEVPEILEEIIEIKHAARDPGSRAKISVKTNDGRIDPIGSCVGMRGARVQAVSTELCNERVDIVLYNPDPVQYAINAMQPAEVISIVVDENTKTMDIVVAEENLAQSIGKGGQNVRLASELTGWTLNIMSEKEATIEKKKEIKNISNSLELDIALAQAIVEEGFSSLKEIAYVSKKDIASVEGINEDLAEKLQAKAKDKLLTLEIAQQEQIDTLNTPSEELLSMEGIDEKLAYKLASKGIISMEDLADQSIDELLLIEGIDTEKAGKLIMTARKPWFDDASN